VGGIISLWWAASFRYGGRHHLVMMGGLDRNQHEWCGADGPQCLLAPLRHAEWPSECLLIGEDWK
jgi:hypothetical protein